MIKSRLLFPWLFLSLFVVSNPIVAQGQNTQHPPVADLKKWESFLKSAEKKIDRNAIDDEILKKMRAELGDLGKEIRMSVEAALSEADSVHEELDLLGTPPDQAVQKESAMVASRRKAIENRITEIEGFIKEAELLSEKVDRVLGRISSLRVSRFKEKVFTRTLSPLFPSVWQKAVSESLVNIKKTVQGLNTWRSSDSFKQQMNQLVLRIAAALLLTLVIVGPFCFWLVKKFGRITEAAEVLYLERLRACLVVDFAGTLLPSALAGSIYFVLESVELLTEPYRFLATTVFNAFVLVFFVAAFCRAFLASSKPSRRLVPISDRNARIISIIVVSIGLVFAVYIILDQVISVFGASLELIAVYQFISGLLITALLLVLFLKRDIWFPSVGSDAKLLFRQHKTLQRLRLWGILLLFSIPLTAISGYVSLSIVLARQFILTAALMILVILLHNLGKGVIAELLAEDSVLGIKLRRDLDVSEEVCKMLGFWVVVVIDFVILSSAGIALLVLWGAGREDLEIWLYKAFFGFRVGSVRISISDILMALIIFSGLLILTRIIQRTLEYRIFPRTRLDTGIRNSTKVAVGYLGFILAAALSISVLGIDLSNLAIIAGALSIGIGFGLQNVVNNFVSGLILLIERPIKVGDWIVVGDMQGYVKKIKVRATEILTFDRASVFIPNSALISDPVLNWTHADKIGRVIVPVGVAYGTDIKKVREILLGIAESHPALLGEPAPSVLFKGFGDSALNFELRGFLSNVDNVVSVSSDICFEIDDAFKREGIEIPFPQHDIHLKDIDRLQQIVVALGEARNENLSRR